MDKEFQKLLDKASNLQSEFVNMGVIATSVETHLAKIVVRCVCSDVMQSSLVISMLKDADLLLPGGIGFIKTLPGTKSLCVEVNIKINQ